MGCRALQSVAFALTAAMALAGHAKAQEMEPRAFSPNPVGMTFVLAGAARSTGGILTDPSLPVDDVNATIDAGLVGVGHTFSLFGQSANAGIVLPYLSGHFTGTIDGQDAEATRQGIGDTKIRISVGLVGAPAMTPAEFVDKLNQNAGNVLSSSERTTAIDLFGAATDSSNVNARAQTVRMVTEDSDLFAAEYNRAFVLAQYIGYLRRNPNDAPDADYTGYDFWLTKLNQFNGNYINAEMVKAFLSSIEYRQRFGP